MAKINNKEIVYYYLDTDLNLDVISEYGVKLDLFLRENDIYVDILSFFNKDNIDERINEMLESAENKEFSTYSVIDNSPHTEKFLSHMGDIRRGGCNFVLYVPERDKTELFNEKIINGYLA